MPDLTAKLRLPQVLAFMRETPWAILPDALEALCASIRSQVDGAPLPTAVDPYAARRTAAGAVSGGVAVIPVYGVLMPRANVFTMYYGGTAATNVAKLVEAASVDPGIGTIVLDLDTPGGSCFLIEETAQAIAKAAKKKPVLGMVNTTCASAGYYLASQCTEIIASPSALAGNIGIIMMHEDASGWLEKIGLRYQVISAGTYKHEGHGGQPLDDVALAAMQAIADDYYTQFVAAVARGRGVKLDAVRTGFGEGRILTARQALAAGVIDRIATFESVLASLGATLSPNAPRADAPALQLAAGADGPLVSAAAHAADVNAVITEMRDRVAQSEELAARMRDHLAHSTPVAGEAAPAAVPLRLVTADSARSNTVTAEELAAKAAAEKAEAIAAERRRVAEISALGRENNVDATRVEGWVNGGVSADAVGRQILQEMKDDAKAKPATAAAINGLHNREGDAPFAGPSDYLRSVVHAARRPEAVDPRLLNLRAAQNVGVGADGGWAVPENVSTALLEASMTGGEVLSRVTQRPITVGNTLKETVVKEEARTSGSRNGGLRSYWVGEGQAITESQAKLRQVELSLKKIAVAVPFTEEQLEDGPQMESFVNEQVPEELRFGMESGIWGGNGTGQPLGFMNTGAVISVAIEAAQTIANTNTHIWKNAAKMFSRMPAGMLPGAAWFINQEMWASILTAVAGTGGFPMFTAPGQLAQFPNGALYGKPIVPVEYASAEGTVGDIVFANFADYLFATKGGVRSATSMHVEFLADKQVMKFVQRCDGQPRTRVPITPLNGTNTVSPYIALAARS